MIYVDGKLLAQALSSLVRIAGNAANSDVHKCVHVTAKKGRLTLRGTNLTVFAERYVSYEGEDEGEWLVMYEPFAHYVTKTGSGKIGLNFGKTSLKMASSEDNDAATAVMRDQNEFNWRLAWKDMTEVKCNGDDLVKAVIRATPSVSTSLASPVLYCVSLLCAEKGQIDVQASDSFRYIYMSVPAKVSPGELCLLVNLPAASEFVSIDTPVEKIGYSESHLAVQSPTGTTFFTLANDPEKFPVFRQTLVDKADVVVTVNSKLLSETLEKSEGFSDTDYRKIHVTLPEKDIMVVSVAGDKGNFNRKLTLDKMRGKPGLDIHIDSRHVTSFVRSAQASAINIHFALNGSKSVRFEDPDTEGLVYVTWPLIVE